MNIRFYNTLTRQKEEFVPLVPGKVGIYSCGPTVYNYAHIGNMRAYIFADVLRRTLEYAGYDVTHVMNITDVGHLTDDADAGEDKMELGKQREGVDAWALAEKYTQAFWAHAGKLGILRPHVICKATDHIREQIDLITALEEKGYTYTTEDGVYFDTSKFDSYGEMAKLDIEGLEGGHRVTDAGKKHKTDFALWKFSPKDKKRDMEWGSPWGRGFPGWHIECSAMSMKYLGTQFDIHTGGIDHIPVHHTNEIAQSEAATGTAPFVRYWLHNEFLNLDKSVKMSKSKGNILTVDTLVDNGYDPLAYRYLCLTAHYRSPLKFSWDSMDQAATAYARLGKHASALWTGDRPAGLSGAGRTYEDQFRKAVTDDLNTAEGLVVIHNAIKDKNLPDGEKLALVRVFDRVLGLGLETYSEGTVGEIPFEVLNLVEERETARREKRWGDADKLRSKITALGYNVEDTKDGPKIAELKS